MPANATKDDCEYFGTDLGEDFRYTSNASTSDGTGAYIVEKWPNLCNSDASGDNAGHIAVGVEKPGTGYIRAGLRTHWEYDYVHNYWIETDSCWSGWKEPGYSQHNARVPASNCDEDGQFWWVQDVDDESCSTTSDHCMVGAYGLTALMITYGTDQFDDWGSPTGLRNTYGARNTYEASDVPGYQANQSAMQGLVVHNGSGWVANGGSYTDVISISRYHMSSIAYNSFFIWTYPPT